MKTSLLFVLSILSFSLYSQTKIYGEIKDTRGYPIPYGSVSFADNSKFTYSDADGKYELTCKECTSDSLYVSSVGFETYKTTYQKNTDQKLDFELEDEAYLLEAIILSEVENPAFAIMRKTIDNKNKNDIRSLSAYQYESYNKIELDMKNLSEDFMELKLLNKLNTSLNELEKLVDEDGRQFFPVFISETMSDYYFKNKPESTKEIVKATRSTGVGMSDGSFTSQFVGASFAQFNFYKNSIRVLDKDFISPIADGWRIYYDVELSDSGIVNDRFSYEITLKPKNENSLAFVGKIWIDKETYALTKINLRIPETANLNFVKSIDFKRDWTQTPSGFFFEKRTDIVIDINNVNEKWASPLLRSTITVDNLVINEPKDNKFYEFPIEVNDDAQSFDHKYWEENRHDTLTLAEKHAFALVDTIKNLPLVRSYLDVFNIMFNGYKDLGKIAIGPYISTYAHNNIEGNRFRLGFKTNTKFSKKMFYEGYLAYGTLDKVLKHNLKSKLILSRYPYIELGFQWRKDLDQLGIKQIAYNNVFDSFTRWGTLTGPYYSHYGNAYIYKQLNKHLSGSIGFNKEVIDPLFNFGFYKPGDNHIHKQLNTSEFEFNFRYAFNEGFLQSDFGRQSLGSTKPIISFDYNLGIKNLLSSDFDYHKFTFKMTHDFGVGILGEGFLALKAGKIIGTLPYPLLNVHLGNQTPIIINSGFNMMNYFEFISDQYVEAKYTHHFNGFFFDRVPLFKRLKWREVVNATALWGNVSHQNRAVLIPESRIFGAFGNYPYMEIGYGVENIFKMLRVEVFQRLTYLNRPDANRFGIKIALQFSL